MTNNSNDPLLELLLSDDEKQLEAALENGLYVEDNNFSGTKKMLEAAASQYQQLTTSKPITLRINQLDLIKIKAKAKRNNIPYQTLLGALVHEFADSKKELTIK